MSRKVTAVLVTLFLGSMTALAVHSQDEVEARSAESPVVVKFSPPELDDRREILRASRSRPSAKPSPATKVVAQTQPKPAHTHARKSAVVPVGAAAWAASARAVRLRNCESGGNYRAVNPSGKYRGAYQMDRAFWIGNGGNPALTPDQASKAEQDGVAYRGWKARGWQPWPHCGYVR